jgi:RNA polymerase subunit RPABC4/transcription elongation factor Spt4
MNINKNKLNLFIALSIPLIIIICFIIMVFDNDKNNNYQEYRGMVVLTDQELSEVVGQAGILNIAEIIGIDNISDYELSGDMTHDELQGFLLSYLSKLSTENPEEMVEIYKDMIYAVNHNEELVIPLNSQYVMETVIMDSINLLKNTVEELGLGTIGIKGLDVNVEGKFNLRIKH